MKPDDFPQFDDPRVREVMAAAANLVEALTEAGFTGEYGPIQTPMGRLKTELFAAQHSKPKAP